MGLIYIVPYSISFIFSIQSALFCACGNGATPVVQHLVLTGCDMEMKDREGRTAVFAATAVGHREIVEYLIRSGCDCGVVDKNGKTVKCVEDIGRYLKISEMIRFVMGDRKEGRDEEGEEWDVNVESESEMYRYLMKHHKIAKFSGCSCRVCKHEFRECEGRYRCVECEGLYICRECIMKGETVELTGHEWRHEFEVLIGE